MARMKNGCARLALPPTCVGQSLRRTNARVAIGLIRFPYHIVFALVLHGLPRWVTPGHYYYPSSMPSMDTTVLVLIVPGDRWAALFEDGVDESALQRALRRKTALGVHKATEY